MTGTYRHDDLVDLIEANGINLFFFPSVCPETFSYVTEEMIRLERADRRVRSGRSGRAALRRYPKARLCDEVSARSALATLVAFHAELAAREVSVA